MTTEGRHPLAAELRSEAESIGKTFAQVERACLEAGSHLSQAIPDLTNLALLFDTLSQAVEGEAIGAASDDLDKIASELTRAADELTDESRALTDLVSLNRSIGAQIAALLTSVRTITTLVVIMKIEAAPLSERADNLTAFAEGLQELAERARHALDEYRATHGKLDALLRSASGAQTQFQQSHQAGLRSISLEIAESLGAVVDLRRRTLAALRDIGALLRAIGEQIGQCVVALQVGDSTRQRVEHVHSAVELTADHLEGQGSAALADQASADDPERMAARFCRLQALQLDGALNDFMREIGTVSGSLDGLAAETDELARRGRTLFGASDREDGSFLETLEHKLAAARTIVEQCRRARGVVDQAAGAVATTMADLQQRTASLTEIVGDVTIIGTNALLRSTRLGERGKGFTLIAQELRAYSGQIVGGIKDLPPALSRVVAGGERVTEAGRSLDSQRLAKLDQRMSAAIDAFGVNGKQMTAALERLGREAESIRQVLDRAAATLAVREEIGSMLKASADTLDAIGARFGDDESRAPLIDPLLDDLLRPFYTMASERGIHDAFTNRLCDKGAAAPPDVRPTRTLGYRR